MVTWGGWQYGGDSWWLKEDLTGGVQRVVATRYSFAALKEDGRVVIWGSADNGGGMGQMARELAINVVEVFAVSKNRFAARKGDGRVVEWGLI